MAGAARRWTVWAGMVAALLPGCLAPGEPRIEELVGHLSEPPTDLAFGQAALPAPPPELPPPSKSAPPPDTPVRLRDRLILPSQLPGTDAATLDLPRYPTPDDPQRAKKLADYRTAVARLYPPLPPLDGDVALAPGPEGRPFDLPQLQQVAMANNPRLRQAAADAEAARGQAVQAGFYPNPGAGFQGDQIGAQDRPGQLGFYVSQVIKTAGKISLARAVALLDHVNAEIALRRARYDLLTQVRGAYFSALIAQETVRIALALARFTEETYRVQIDLLSNGQVAPYDPSQGRAMAVQARVAVAQARNRYLSAWKQLAAAVGTPDLPPSELAGRPDLTPPNLNYDALRARAFAEHTDVLTARATVLRQQYALKQARAQAVPDVNANVVLEYDGTDRPQRTQFNLQLGGALPVFDRNQGNILTAKANLARAVQDVNRTQLTLTATLADAYERYESNRTTTALYRRQVLPDLVRTFRGMVVRSDQEPAAVSQNDLVSAQQNLMSGLTTYLTALSAQWQAAVDLAAVLQSDDLPFLNPTVTAADCPPLLELLAPGGSWPVLGAARSSELRRAAGVSRLVLNAPPAP